MSFFPDTDEDAEDKTYSIIRFFRDSDEESYIVLDGLTLEEVQAHCQREDTHGEGWFDGYEEE
jgi:hypothetical protein